LLAVDTFQTSFTVLCPETVTAIFVMDGEVGDEEAVFVVPRIDAHVAVLVVRSMVRVGGVLAPHIHDAGPRSCEAQFVKLFKE
jgi:hypothetical protein